jgi:hypothetical protein
VGVAAEEKGAARAHCTNTGVWRSVHGRRRPSGGGGGGQIGDGFASTSRLPGPARAPMRRRATAMASGPTVVTAATVAGERPWAAARAWRVVAVVSWATKELVGAPREAPARVRAESAREGTESRSSVLSLPSAAACRAVHTASRPPGPALAASRPPGSACAASRPPGPTLAASRPPRPARGFHAARACAHVSRAACTRVRAFCAEDGTCGDRIGQGGPRFEDGKGGGGNHEGRRERGMSSRSRRVEGEEDGKGRRGRPAGHGYCWRAGGAWS